MENKKQKGNERPTLPPKPFYELTVLYPEKQLNKNKKEGEK